MPDKKPIDLQLDLQTTVARNGDIIFSDMGEETVMMSIEKGEYYGLDAIGRRVWELLETTQTVSSLCSRLCEEFEVTQEQCSRDVLTFLQTLAEKDLIILSNA